MKNHETLKALREAGYYTFVEHRRVLEGCSCQHNAAPKGGTTFVSVNNGDKYWYAQAKCSKHDHYCKRIGLSIALGRLMKLMREEGELI